MPTNRADTESASQSAESQPARHHRPVSLGDVARAAGVSTASVSRALNTPERVSPELRRRIEEKIKDLGYIPSGAARALVTRKSSTIGAIVPTLDDAIFALGISSLQRRLAHLNYNLLVAASEYDWEQELRETQSLLKHGVEGLMLIGEAHHQELYRMLERAEVPFVNCWTYSNVSPYPCIGFDNRRMAYGLVEYLTALGHRDIAMISGITQGNDRALGRVMGVRDALESVGLSLSEDRFVEQPYGIAEGRNGMRELLSRRQYPPTAVVCGNDVLAMGAVFECQSLGLGVPDFISIAGFDDLNFSAHLQPGLTTVRVPSIEMGQRAAEYLVQRIAGKHPLEHVQVEASLVVRATTSKPRTWWSG